MLMVTSKFLSTETRWGKNHATSAAATALRIFLVKLLSARIHVSIREAIRTTARSERAFYYGASMTKEFEAVHSAVDELACALVAEEADSTTIADALIQVGLSLWAADSKRYDDAETLLRAYVAKRDAN